jgi:hypothetical protein
MRGRQRMGVEDRAVGGALAVIAVADTLLAGDAGFGGYGSDGRTEKRSRENHSQHF